MYMGAVRARARAREINFSGRTRARGMKRFDAEGGINYGRRRGGVLWRVAGGRVKV